MSADREPSLAELKIESERTRAAFTDTVDDLLAKVNDTAAEFKARISPANIKAEVSDYVIESGQEWVHSLKRRARDNPLQTAAIGLGLAYPLWRVVRSIPAPIMLIGAGFLLAHQKWPGSVEEDLTAQVSKRTSDFASAVQDAAVDGVEALSRTAAEAKAAVSGGAKPLIGKVSGFTEDAANAASEMGHRLADETTSATNSAIRSMSDAKDSTIKFAMRNPLLVAGAGLAIGALVAAAVSVSDTENRVFGQHSDDLKDQAKRRTAAGVEQAKEFASDVVSDVAAAAAQQGLSAEALSNEVEGLTAGVRSVADKGMQTALGEDKGATSQTNIPYTGSQRRVL